MPVRKRAVKTPEPPVDAPEIDLDATGRRGRGRSSGASVGCVQLVGRRARRPGEHHPAGARRRAREADRVGWSPRRDPDQRRRAPRSRSRTWARAATRPAADRSAPAHAASGRAVAPPRSARAQAPRAAHGDRRGPALRRDRRPHLRRRARGAPCCGRHEDPAGHLADQRHRHGHRPRLQRAPRPRAVHDATRRGSDPSARQRPARRRDRRQHAHRAGGAAHHHAGGPPARAPTSTSNRRTARSASASASTVRCTTPPSSRRRSRRRSAAGSRSWPR